MKIKTAYITGLPLDWAVATCLGLSVQIDAVMDGIKMEGWYVSGYYMDPNRWIRLGQLRYSADWAHGGPIIEREKLDVCIHKPTRQWCAATQSSADRFARGYGPTPLIAAMRCYVSSELGDEIEIPEEFQK